MVESNALDDMFLALADTTRRSILELVAQSELSIGEIAKHFSLTFAAISKHIQVLERAGLVTKKRRGKEQIVIIVPSSLTVARDQIERYAQMWSDRFDRLEDVLTQQP